MKKSPLSVGLISLGCSKNLADTQVMSGYLLKAGYTLAPSPDRADIILVNTCAFIESARAEGAENIVAACEHKHQGHCRAVVVAGCMPQRYREQMAEAFPDVDAFLGVDELDTLPALLTKALAKHDEALMAVKPGAPTRLFEKPIQGLRLTGPVFAYVKISEGCNHACAFCSIPGFRGHLRSRPMDAILTEVKELLATGTREINLVAQDVTAYGKDLRDGTTLAKLLHALEDLPGDFWVRFLYGFHNHVTDALLTELQGATHLLPYFDLPIQHADPTVLRAMRRADTIPAIETFAARIRTALPEATLRTTCMVGFPGETPAAFKTLLDYIKATEFDHLGTFIFSPEEGTAAAELTEGIVPAETSAARQAELMQVQKEIAKAKNRARVGSYQTALVVDYEGDDGLVVRLRHQAPEVDGVTHIRHAPESVQPGDFVAVQITGVRGYDLTAKLVNTVR